MFEDAVKMPEDCESLRLSLRLEYTRLLDWGDLAGWQIDGPKYPAKTGERQFNNRWVRFKNEDVARFYRDYLPLDVKRELDVLQARWPEERRWKNDSHIMPWLVQLRSLLLNETPQQLASNAVPEKFSDHPRA